MSGSDIVGLLREDALRLDEAGDEDRPVDGPHSIAARVREALDLIDRLTTERNDEYGQRMVLGRQHILQTQRLYESQAEVARLSEQVEKQGKVLRQMLPFLPDASTPHPSSGPIVPTKEDALAALNGLVVVGEDDPDKKQAWDLGEWQR